MTFLLHGKKIELWNKQIFSQSLSDQSPLTQNRWLFHLKQNQTQARRTERGQGRTDGEDIRSWTRHTDEAWLAPSLLFKSFIKQHIHTIFFCLLYQRLEKVRVWAKSGPSTYFYKWSYKLSGSMAVYCKAEAEGWEPWPMNFVYYLVFFPPQGLPTQDFNPEPLSNSNPQKFTTWSVVLGRREPCCSD